jgi:predicted RNA-binding Zn ribbon-like protein
MEEFRSGLGAAWLDFLVTLVGRYREDRQELLCDPGALQTWLARYDLAPRVAPEPADLEQALQLREALHALTRAAYARATPPSAASQVVAEALAHDRPLRLRRGAVRVQRPDSYGEALARLARAAVEDLTRQPSSPLRACGDDTCSAFYLDPTGRRRWCSDQRCGNRSRVRAHRARQQND